MKKYSTIVILISLVAPVMVFAFWWNPTSWFSSLLRQKTTKVSLASNQNNDQKLENILNKSYESLYRSRKYFNSEILKLHTTSKNLEFIWHPEQEKMGYAEVSKGLGNLKTQESSIDSNNYKISIISNRGFENKDLYTHVTITKAEKLMDSRNYSGVALNHIYKIKVNQTYYYLLGLCRNGNQGCGQLVPIINEGESLIVGSVIKDVNFSNYLKIEDFFTENGELYTVLDDSRYFFSYSGSNNASYNSAVPRIFKFDRETANLILAINDFNDIYKKATEKIEKDLYSLRNSIPSEIRPLIMNHLTGKSLIPYFDYYLGMAIIADPTHSSETRKEVEKLYLDFFGKQNKSEAHFDGYKDFER